MVPNHAERLKYLLCEIFQYESFWKVLYIEFLENKCEFREGFTKCIKRLMMSRR